MKAHRNSSRNSHFAIRNSFLAALVLVGVLAAGFMVVSGRAAGPGFHWPNRLGGATTYTFNNGGGLNSWSNTSRWTPSYPGTTINAGDTANIIAGAGEIDVAVVIDGTLTVGAATSFGETSPGSLTLNSGSLFSIDGSFYPNDRPFTANSGATITNNGSLGVRGLVLNSGATLNNNTASSVIFFSNGTMTGDLTNGIGAIDLDYFNTNVVTGNFDNGTGTFRTHDHCDFTCFIFGFPPDVGKLNVTSTATLGGTFDFQTGLPPPALGQEFIVLDAAGGITGTFTNSFVDLALGRRANISYTATQAKITIGLQPPQTFVVTKTADTNDSTCDADCSLREAKDAANSTPAADTINFDIPTSDPGCNGGVGPCTITLGALGQIQLAESVTVNGPVAPALPVTVDGNNLNRVFIVSNGTAFVNNLTVAHAGTTGVNSSGGGLFVNGAATATLTGMTFRDNTVTAAKGGGAGVNLGGTLNIHNSTFSNNTAVTGGALFNESGGTLNLVNVTVTNNTATGGAGGLDTQNQTTSIRNSIIANNSSNISGTFTDLGNNIASGDPLVGALQDNGGPTFTRALQPGSPAIDAGNNCVFDDTCSPVLGVALTTDQRGTGFSRKFDGNGDSTLTVDIGAYENPASVAIETDVILTSGDLVVTDGNGGTTDDTLTMALSSGNVRVNDPTHTLNAGAGATQDGPNAVLVPLASITGNIQVDTLGGNDTLTLDLSGGDFIPAGGLTFNGGSQTSVPGDKLVITGGSQGTVIYNYSNLSPHEGNIILSNFGTVSYTGLEPISNSGTAADVVFNLPPLASAATLADDGTGGNGMSRFSGATFETTDFSNPTGSLTVSSGFAADTLTVNALPDFNASLGIGGGGSPFSTIDFTGGVTLAADKNLVADASGTISLSSTNSDLATSGTGTITLTTARNIALASGSSLTTVNGPISLFANQQASPTSGSFVGIIVDGATIQSTTGAITLLGKGGDLGSGNIGIRVLAFGIVGAGTGSMVTATGTGGASPDGSVDSGVEVTGANARITSGGGAVQVTGTGGGTPAGTGNTNYGVAVRFTGQITAGGSGTVTVTGNGGTGTGGSNHGVWVTDPSSSITSGGGNVSVTGTEGGSASIAVVGASSGTITSATNGGTLTLIGDSMNFEPTSTISAQAGSSVMLRQRTNGVAINLGSTFDTTAATLELSDAELDQVTAGTLHIGDLNSGQVNVSAAITQTGKITNIDAPIRTTVHNSGSLGITGTVNSELLVNTSGTVAPGTSPGLINSGNATFDSGSTFAVEIGGTTPGNTATNHDQLNVTGSVSLTNPTLSLASFGGFTPVTGQTFVIVNNDSTDAITGTFNGLPEGATIPSFLGSALVAKITYVGGTDSNDVVLTALTACTPPSTVYVDDNWVGTAPGADPDGPGPATNFGCDSFATIQDGVDGVAPSGTVNVAAGAYPEQPVIGKSLILIGAGAGSTNINAPASLTPRFNNFRILLEVNNAATVEASGITVKGPLNLNGCPESVAQPVLRRYYGVYVRGGASLNLHDSSVLDIRENNPAVNTRCLFGTAINAGSSVATQHQVGTLTLNNTQVSSFQARGVVVDNAGSSGTITNNTLTGSASGSFVQTVMLIAIGATANITGNTISGAQCTDVINCGPDVFNQAAAVGISLTAPANGVQVSNNTILNNDYGINYAANPGITNVISGNALTANRYFGVVNNEGNLTITGNTFSGASNVAVLALSINDPLNSTASDSSATLTGNTITGATVGLQLIDDPNNPPDAFLPVLTTHFNRFVAATTAIDNPQNSTSDMENNWWGCNAGPGNAGCGAVNGTGADFDPWIVLGVSAVPTSVGPGGASSVTADMTHNSATAIPVGTLPDMAVAWSATQGTMAPPTGTVTAGTASSTFTSTSSSAGTACATVDNQLICTPVGVSAPSFAIDDVTHLEGDPPGTTSYVFTVTKTGATALSSSVNFTTQDGSATLADNDYQTNSGMLNFGPTDTTMQITVLVNRDTNFETNEAFNVHLSGVVNATISDADGTGTITNDDSPSISGHVAYDDSVTTFGKNVTMTLTGNNGFVTRTTTTDANGDYSFANVPTGNDYTLTPSKVGDVGALHIESIDAAKVARFVAGLDVPTPNQRIAADADGDTVLTSFDAALLARYVAGLPPPLGIVGTWKFVPVNRTYPNFAANQTAQNFTAILVGDTDGNWLPAIPVESRKQ